MSALFHHMIKSILLTCCLTLTLALPVWAHTMPVSEIDLNGISPKATLSFVRQIYGEPSAKESFTKGDVRSIKYHYGPLLEITGSTTLEANLPEDELVVAGFRCKANSFSTPRGFRVDQPISKVISLFGEGERFNSKNTSGQEEISYLYMFPGDRGDILIFYTDSAGFITEIAYRSSLTR
jgi:hypothetical protein